MEGEIVNPVQPAAFVPQAERTDPRFVLSPEDIPNVGDLVIEDGKPVDNLFVEKEYRLLTEPLYSSWTSPSGEFLAVANVGLFYAYREPPLVPDVMLSLGVPAGRDLSLKENRSYLMWIIGKPPDVVIEIVSDLRGGEETDKMSAYARIGVTYYVIHDPQNRLHHGLLRAFSLRDGVYQPIEPSWLEKVGLGLTFWEGEFQGQQHSHWLRWCDCNGVVIPTGGERAEQEKQRAQVADRRAEQEKQRAQDADRRAEQEKQRAQEADRHAEQEKQRAEQEKQRAEQEKQRAERLAAQLRSLGVEPEA